MQRLRRSGRNDHDGARDLVSVARSERLTVDLDGAAGDGDREHVAPGNRRAVGKRCGALLNGDGGVRRSDDRQLVSRRGIGLSERIGSRNVVEECGNVRELKSGIHAERLSAAGIAVLVGVVGELVSRRDARVKCRVTLLSLAYIPDGA